MKKRLKEFFIIFLLFLCHSECNEESRLSIHEMFHFVQHDKEDIKTPLADVFYISFISLPANRLLLY